jgi:hypothetical protein
MNSRFPTIECKEQQILLSRIAQLCDKGGELTNKMHSSGFLSIEPIQKFWKSFCEKCEDKIHDQFLIEEAKMFVSVPDGAIGHYLFGKRSWFSPFIDSLCIERDRDIEVGSDVRAHHEPWKIELDPCRRRQVLMQCKDRDKLTELEYEKEHILANKRKLELSYYATRVEGLEDLSLPDCVRLLIGRSLEGTAYDYDRKRSKPNFPVFSRKINSTWSLCLALTEERFLTVKQRYIDEFGRKWTPFYMSCYLSSGRKISRVQVPLNVERYDFMVVRYHRMIPGFFNAYSKYDNLSELYLVIDAWVSLFKLVEGEIWSIIMEELELPGHLTK